MKNFKQMHENKLFWINKRIFDIILSLLLLPLFFTIAIFLLVFNLFYNTGELFFIQKRMGKNCEFFLAIKFRTMTNVEEITRDKELVKIVDQLGREVNEVIGQIVFYIYDDGTAEKVFVVE